MKRKRDRLLYLSQEVVKQICEKLDVVTIMREVFELHGLGKTILPPEAYLAWTNTNRKSVRSLANPAYVGGSLNMAGMKIINSNPANPWRGCPRASGLLNLYDPFSTRILCIMEGAYLSSQRTAGVTALAVELLQGRAIECAAVIGAGVLAKSHIQMFVRRLPQLCNIWLFDSDRVRARMLQQELSPALQKRAVTLQVASSAEEQKSRM